MQLDLASSCLPPSHPSTCWDIALYCGTAATAHSRWGSPAATGFEIKNWTNPHFGALDGQTQSEFWKRAKWLQVCQLLLHPCLLLNIILYSETEEQFVLPDEGATLLFVSNSYFHGKTVCFLVILLQYLAGPLCLSYLPIETNKQKKISKISLFSA